MRRESTVRERKPSERATTVLVVGGSVLLCGVGFCIGWLHRALLEVARAREIASAAAAGRAPLDQLIDVPVSMWLVWLAYFVSVAIFYVTTLSAEMESAFATPAEREPLPELEQDALVSSEPR